MIRNLFTFFTFSLAFFGCANQIPPSGGPIDNEPPTVVKTFPESGTLNFKEKFVEFWFNEYIDKRTVTNSVFISPYFKDDIEIKWSGKKMRITFPEKLRENKTYVVTLGTEISDLRGNKLAESVTLRFSTGDKIDEGFIAGKVFDDKPDGVMIFFYLIDTIGTEVQYDSIRPDFICQTSKEGTFSLSGLPNGVFRIIAVRDQMKNFLFDINEDEIGIPINDYVLDDSIKKINNVFFELIKIDTVRPVVNSVKFEDLNHIKINFNEAIDINSISLNNFFIIDDFGTQTDISGFFATDKNIITIITSDLIANKDYSINIKGVKDLAGNEINKTTIKFSTEELKDTIPVNLKNIDCNYSSSVMEYFNPVCSLYFNDLVKKEDFEKAVEVEDTLKKKIQFQISRTDSSNFILKFSDLKQREKLFLKIDLSLLQDLSGNKLDTILVKTIETNSEAEYGSISGSIKNRTLVSDLVLEAARVNKQKFYKVGVENDKYQIKNVLPGAYLLKLVTTNEILPKASGKFSNPFVYHPDTIKVRSRWPTTDVNFDAKDLIR